MLQTPDGTRKIFTCSLHNGHCCAGETLELDHDDWLDDCEGGPFRGLSVQYVPKNLFSLIKYWWKYRYCYFVEFNISMEDLKALRDRINEELPKMEEERGKNNRRILTSEKKS